MGSPLTCVRMTSPAAPSVHPASVWEDFVDIFYAPRDVFARRRSAGFLVPLIVLVVVIAILFWAGKPLFQSIIDAEFARASAHGTLTSEQLEMARSWNERMSVVVVPLSVLLSVLAVGVVVTWVARAFDVRLSYTASCVIATYAEFPRIIEHVVNLIQGYLLPVDSLVSQYQIRMGLARFADPETTAPALLALLSRFDLFTFWVTALLAIGVAVIGETTTRRAVLVASTLWILGTLAAVGGALRS